MSIVQRLVPDWLKTKIPSAQRASTGKPFRFHSYRVEELEKRVLLSYGVIADFTGTNGANPVGTLSSDGHGDLFGTTEAGGANSTGTIFEIAAGTSTITTLYSFTALSSASPGINSDGANPEDHLTYNNGNLFGSASNGGANGVGTLFEFNIASSIFTKLWDFVPSTIGHSANPTSGVSLDANGNIFGTIKTGGANGEGAIFELPYITGVGYNSNLTYLYSFSLATGGINSDGKNPYSGVSMDSNGDLFGTARQAGTSGDGTIWELPYTAGSGYATAITILYTFTDGVDGKEPSSHIILESNGTLVGTAKEGGANNLGDIWELTKSGSSYSSTVTTLYSFTGGGASGTGQYALGPPTMDSKGDLFGMTVQGGQDGAVGTIWELPAGSTTVTLLHTFTGSTNPPYNSDGAGIASFNTGPGLYMDSEGDLFGDTTDGGPDGDGVVFEIPSTTQLVFASMPNTTAGTLPSFSVDVEDQYGNIIKTDDSTVTLSVKSGPGLLGGTDSVAAVNGVATFSNVTIDTAGTYSLNAVDGSDTSATSNAFTVSAAAAADLAFSQQPSTVTAGNAISPGITVDVEDQFGNIVTTNSSNVTLSVHSGPGSLGGTDTVAASAGVATFSDVLIDTAGTYTLTASDSGLTPTNSNSFTVNHGAASKLGYAVEPSDVATGAAISPSIVVDVEDQFGNVVTSNTSNVKLAVESGPGSLTGTTTVAASNGVATFSNVIVTEGGTYTLIATDTGLSSAISSSFTVSNGAASQVVFDVQPTDVVAGDPDSPSIVVDIEDPDGNIVSDNNSTVTLSVATGPGTLSGTVSVAAVNGVATFDNVMVDTAGSYTLTASDANLVTDTSDSFTVSAAASAQLVITQQPTNTVINDPIDPPVVVQVEDQFGNLVTTDTSSVTLSVNTGPGNINGDTTVAAVGGIATFNSVSLDTLGVYTLAASDGSLSGAISNSFHITLTAPTQLVFNQQPTNITAGQSFTPSVVVYVEDAFGNVADADSSNVTISIANGPTGGSLGGTLTVQAQNGVATFSDLSLTTAGTYTLEAVDSNTNLTSAVSNSFNVSPAAATQVAFIQQPVTVATGIVMSPVIVDVEDQYGNRVTSDSSTITLSLASGPGQLSGTLMVADVDGVASFNNLSLNEVGTYKLQATDGSLTPAISNAFTDIPPVRELVVARETITAQQFGDVFFNVKLALEDQSGNLVTNDTSTVIVSLASPSNGAVLSGTTTAQFSDGYAVFTRLSVNTSGTYILSFDNGEAETTITVTDPIPVYRIPMKYRWWFGTVEVAPPVPIPDPFAITAGESGSSSSSPSSAAPSTVTGDSPAAADSNSGQNLDSGDTNNSSSSTNPVLD
jgi:uncharacterized repeat protein (TIGR03803 family)